jgi:hypothetical protein
MKYLFALISFFFLNACTAQHTKGKVKHKKTMTKSIQEGICGTITFQSGNRMPMIDAPSSGKSVPVRRVIEIYERCNMNQVESIEGFYGRIPTRKVATIESDDKGKFCISLPSGHYSMFTKEPKGLYANSFDGEGNIFPIVVEKGKITMVDFLISYSVVY